jgi:Polyketide cyclase / dehydrase and lipid transport
VARPVEVTVTGHTKAELEGAFDTIVPMDLASIFEPWLILPGVDGVRDQTGPWDQPGRSRTVQLSDGSEVPERLTAVDRPHGFAYRVGPFPGSLGSLASAADGEWHFTPAPGGGTEIRWSYRFEAAAGRRSLLRLLIAPLWRGYARRALTRAVAAADAAA